MTMLAMGKTACWSGDSPLYLNGWVGCRLTLEGFEECACRQAVKGCCSHAWKQGIRRPHQSCTTWFLMTERLLHCLFAACAGSVCVRGV